MKTTRLLIAAAALALTSCQTAPPPIDPATGKPVTFSKALAVGLVRLASEEPRKISMEESLFGARQPY